MCVYVYVYVYVIVYVSLSVSVSPSSLEHSIVHTGNENYMMCVFVGPTFSFLAWRTVGSCWLD